MVALSAPFKSTSGPLMAPLMVRPVVVEYTMTEVYLETVGLLPGANPI